MAKAAPTQARRAAIFGSALLATAVVVAWLAFVAWGAWTFVRLIGSFF